MTAIEKFKAFVNKKKIDVIGIGISNTPLIEKLLQLGAFVCARDKKTKEELGEIANELTLKGVKLVLGENYLENIEGEIIFRSPGIRFDNKEINKAVEKGAILTSEMELFFEICPCKIIAVTGSDGKTTTTTLISKFIEKQGLKCHLGGNIGKPLLPQIDEISKDDIAVLELSSFQLQTMKKSPATAVITNITPNHLDWHISFEEYITAKKNIFLFQNKEDRLVINFDNDITNSFKNEAKGEVFSFSSAKKLKNGVYLENDKIIAIKDGKENIIMSTNDIKLIGKHNLENYMAAICATYGLVSNESIVAVAKEFSGVAHRLELVRELNGVKYYNSSIDSSPNRTIAALSTFSEKVILICGGKDKGIPYDEIGEPIVKKVKILLTIGKTAGKIEEAVLKSPQGKDIEIIRCSTYEEVVKTAFNKAKQGDVVLLSPASTSFDMFKNFEERGETFKKLVKQLNVERRM